MTAIYFQANDILYGMDAVLTTRAPLTATLSQAPMSDGTVQSDNYIVNMQAITITGVITDIKSAITNNQQSSADWVDGIYNLIRSKSSVSLKYREDKQLETGWFITSFDPGQDKRYGVGAVRDDGTVIQSFKISITFSKPIIARGLTTTVQPPDEYLDLLQNKQDKAAATQEFAEEEPKKQTAEEELEELKKNFVYFNKMADKLGKEAILGEEQEPVESP